MVHRNCWIIKQKPKWNRSHWGSDKMFANYSLFVSLSWWNNKIFWVELQQCDVFFIQNSIYLYFANEMIAFFRSTVNKSPGNIFSFRFVGLIANLYSVEEMPMVNNGKICDNDDDKTYFTLWQWYKASQPGFAPCMYGIWIEIQCCL